MKRRDFMALLGGAAAWPLGAEAQQSMPVIGVLGPGSAESNAFRVTPFRQGLNESGYVLGQNLMVEFRWAESQYDRLPALAADLAQRQVAAGRQCHGCNLLHHLARTEEAGTTTRISPRGHRDRAPYQFNWSKRRNNFEKRAGRRRCARATNPSCQCQQRTRVRCSNCNRSWTRGACIVCGRRSSIH